MVIGNWGLGELDTIAILCDTAGIVISSEVISMSYPGGKASDGVFHKIINQIPPHDVYIEPFLGAGAIMLHKRPAAASIGIDVDGDVINSWMDPHAKNGDTRSGLPGLIVKKGDAISFLKSYAWQGGEFVYCDPPYLREVRASKKPLYKHEFWTPEEHMQLLDVLKALPCMVALSGYWSSLYESSLQGWRTINFQAGTRAGRATTEWLWMNYPEPTALHDYAYLGENFREREKITRQKKRWKARLLRMSTLQRYALLSTIAELGEPYR